MTYTAGSLIVATDYNGFVSTNGANVNVIWSTGATRDDTKADPRTSSAN